MKFYFFYNKWAVKALAKEIRYASYGVAALAVMSNIGWIPVFTYAIAALCWAGLQLTAFVLESIRLNLDPEGTKEPKEEAEDE